MGQKVNPISNRLGILGFQLVWWKELWRFFTGG